MTKDEAQSRRGGTDGLFTKPSKVLGKNPLSRKDKTMKKRPMALLAFLLLLLFYQVIFIYCQ
jgi:hypothetical protein